MPPEPTPVTYQDVLDHLAKVATENGDLFKLKVVRRPSAASTSTQHVATFADATWSHIANAEGWLSQLAGGGLYVIQIFDGRNDRKHHGTISPSEISGAPRQPDPRVTRLPGWLGPNLIEAGAATSANGAGAIAYGAQTFEAPGTSPATSRIVADVGLGGLFSTDPREELRKRELDLADRERRAELAQERRANEERTKSLEKEIGGLRDLVNAIGVKLSAPPPPPPPGPDVGAVVTGILSAAAPIIAAIMQSSADTRRAQLEVEKARQEREAKETEAARSKPAIDPQFLEMMDRREKRSEEQIAQFANFMKIQAESAKSNMEMQSTMQRSMIQTIANVAELQLRNPAGSEESGVDWGKVAAGVLAGLAQLRGAGGGPSPQGAPPSTSTPPLAAAPPAPAEPDVEPAVELDAIEDRIRAQGSPAEIVSDLKKALELPSVKAEIEAEGGLMEVFQARLGDFASDAANERYVKALMEELTKAGLAPPA